MCLALKAENINYLNDQSLRSIVDNLPFLSLARFRIGHHIFFMCFGESNESIHNRWKFPSLVSKVEHHFRVFEHHSRKKGLIALTFRDVKGQAQIEAIFREADLKVVEVYVATDDVTLAQWVIWPLSRACKTKTSNMKIASKTVPF